MCLAEKQTTQLSTSGPTLASWINNKCEWKLNRVTQMVLTNYNQVSSFIIIPRPQLQQHKYISELIRKYISKHTNIYRNTNILRNSRHINICRNPQFFFKTHKYFSNFKSRKSTSINRNNGHKIYLCFELYLCVLKYFRVS